MFQLLRMMLVHCVDLNADILLLPKSVECWLHQLKLTVESYKCIQNNVSHLSELHKHRLKYRQGTRQIAWKPITYCFIER